MGGAAEEVLGGVLRLAAARAEGGGGGADPVLEGVEGRAVPRPQLGQGGPRSSGQVQLRHIHIRCTVGEDSVGPPAADCRSY